MESTNAIAAFLEFNNHFQNQIIFHAVSNDAFLQKIRRVVPVEIFRVREKRTLIQFIYNYYDEYKKAPKDDFIDLFEYRIKELPQDLQEKCVNLLDLLSGITGSNFEYILNRIKDAIQHFRMEEAVIECASLVKKGDYDKVKPIILKAIRPLEEFESPYYDLLNDTSFIENRLRGPQYKMLSRIPDLDKMIGGFKETWLITILGATKSGKTWWLMEMALSGVLQGLNVLYVSLEMGKEQIDERFDMMISFATSSYTKDLQDTMRPGPKEKDWVKIKEKLNSIYDVNFVLKNRQKIKKVSHGSLKVMAFNRGRLNYMDIDTILDELVEQEGWVADVLVVDYLGIMKETSPGQKKKERIGENCLGLKEIAAKRNIISLSAMQGNRQAMMAEVFHSHLVADDIDTIFNSDLVMALCQTKVEETQNIGRIYIANYRHGRQHGSIGIVKDLNIGQIVIDTFEVKEKPKEKDVLNAGVDM
jgi:replicative DNA helicase